MTSHLAALRKTIPWVGSLGLLAGLSALTWAQTPLLNFGTGKVPLEGSLSSNRVTPQANDTVLLYFTVTPLKSGIVRTRFVLPPEVVPLNGEPLERRFPRVPALETVTHTLKVSVLSKSPSTVRASATLGDDGALSRAFLLILNPDNPDPKLRGATGDASGKDGSDAQGRPLIIFPSGK